GDARRVEEGLPGNYIKDKRLNCEIADRDKDYAKASTRRTGKNSADYAGEYEPEMETVRDFFLNRQRSKAAAAARRPGRPKKKS
ncbi:MAG: hypothetical protein K2O27_05640, partial [Candidatus Amulumruptor sp.]|nr:hypothetical protein [Candidatus Amulumruptor sp.]